MKHKCDKMPDERDCAIEAIGYVNHWWSMTIGSSRISDIEFCPFCGEELDGKDEKDNENYAKKSLALILSAHLDISELGAEEIVKLLIDAVNHELNRKE